VGQNPKAFALYPNWAVAVDFRACSNPNDKQYQTFKRSSSAFKTFRFLH
jgi:hypothetical protein